MEDFEVVALSKNNCYLQIKLGFDFILGTAALEMVFCEILCSPPFANDWHHYL
jgi:hypothetical protein